MKDPICGMTVDPTTAKYKTKRNGTEFFFCSQHCQIKFEKNPETKIIHEIPTHLPTASEWTCPMHPEIIQDHPGSCPKCGMALEPMGVGADEDLTEYNDMKKRFILAAMFTIPLFFLAMGDMLPGKPVGTVNQTV